MGGMTCLNIHRRDKPWKNACTNTGDRVVVETQLCIDIMAALTNLYNKDVIFLDREQRWYERGVKEAILCQYHGKNITQQYGKACVAWAYRSILLNIPKRFGTNISHCDVTNLSQIKSHGLV